MKDNFILYTLYYDAIMRLTDEQAGRLLKAIYRYVKTEQEEDITDPSIAFAYTLVITQIKESSRKYEEKCKRLRENASKGGLQKAANLSNDLQQLANATQDSNCKQMVANGSNCKQTLADVSIRQDKTRQDKTTNKEEEDNKKKKDEPSLCAGAQSSSSSDYSLVVEYWNNAVKEHGSAMRPLRGLTENRKAAIRARLREHKQEGMAAIRQMIDKAVVSDFLNGRNSRNAIFTFDRLMAPEMFQKTLEGNYDNKPKDEQQPTAEQSSIGRLMQEQAQQREDRNKEQRQRYEGMIAIVERNPQHRCREALVMAYKNGTLKSLGIEWKPE